MRNSEEQLKQIPEGTYDIGNGFFEPDRNLTYNYKRTQILKKANKEEIKNYMSRYRYNPKLAKLDDIDVTKDATVMKILENRKLSKFDN